MSNDLKRNLLCSEGCMEYGTCDLSCINEIRVKYSKGKCAELFVLFNLLMQEYDNLLTENKELKEDNGSLLHINGYLKEQNKGVPELLQIFQDFIKIGNQRWRSCRPDSFEKETLNKAKSLLKITDYENKS